MATSITMMHTAQLKVKYYLVDYVKWGRNSRPALPDGTGFLLLAAPGCDPRWGVFAVDRELQPSDQVRPVPIELQRLLQAAEQYPPAMALARDALSIEFDGEQPTDELFCIRYAACLDEYLTQQGSAPYVFAKAIGDELGYLRRGEFYWVLRYLRGSRTVAWVSSDYFVYHNPVSDFDLSPDQLDALLLPFSPAT